MRRFIESLLATMLLLVPLVAPAATTTDISNTSTNCLFSWAEKSFPQFFAPSGSVSQTVAPYFFRYYAGTGNYLATSSVDGHLLAVGPATGGQLVDLGLASSFLSTAACVSSGAPTGVTLAVVNAQTVGGTAIASSTQMGVGWTPPASTTVVKYLISASDAVGGAAISTTVAANVTSATLTGLKAATAYSVVVSACSTTGCEQPAAAAAITGTTSSEYWQLQGSGNTTAGLTRIVSDGNARISATRFGPEASSVTANRIQLYYGPSLVSGRQTLSTALTGSSTTASLPASYLSFASSGATTGLSTPTPAATLVETMATGQGVPLSAAMGGKVRVFFEAQGIDRKTRIFSIDSVDGYTGQDFNISSTSTTCATTADYSAGGGCAFSVAIGVEGDTTAPNAKILNARQNKVGYPTQTDWRWDGAPGTFMVFTSGSVAGCSTANRTHGYAVWSGSKWEVQYDSKACPKLFTNVQAAFPMHIGGVKYKLYYGDTSNTAGQLSSNLPFLGPKRLLYADGVKSGLADRVDFEDWESQVHARDVVFVWPNGDKLDNTAEGYIDDFHFMAPTGNLDLQVMYLAITNGTAVPLGAAAILLNP